MPSTPAVISYRLADANKVPDESKGKIEQMLEAGPPSDTPLTDFATDLLKLQLEDSDYQVLSPHQLLAHADDSEYATTVDHLSIRLGQQGTWLVDADIIVRETDKGYPVATIWVCDAIADAAERIAYWASKFGIGTAGDLLLCILTPNRAPKCTAAQRERNEAMVMHAVDKVYWLGSGHPTANHLTRYEDLHPAIESARASVLHL